MRDDAIIGFPFPSGYPRRELQPSSTQFQVVRLGSADELVDAVSNATELPSGADQSLPRGLRDTKLARLPARDESPLLFGHGGDTCSRRLSSIATALYPISGGYCSSLCNPLTTLSPIFGGFALQNVPPEPAHMRIQHSVQRHAGPCHNGRRKTCCGLVMGNVSVPTTLPRDGRWVPSAVPDVLIKLDGHDRDLRLPARAPSRAARHQHAGRGRELPAVERPDARELEEEEPGLPTQEDGRPVGRDPAVPRRISASWRCRRTFGETTRRSPNRPSDV